MKRKNIPKIANQTDALEKNVKNLALITEGSINSGTLHTTSFNLI